MTKPRVMVDGYNLALEKGTGIATYARNLAGELKKGGYHVDLLYGVRATMGKNKLLSEIGFFDPYGKSYNARQVAGKLMTSAFGVTARQVPITGNVVPRHMNRPLPDHDRIFNARQVYELARWHFRVYGDFMPTAYENPATIAHWTYPLPIRLKNAANIYTIHDLVPLNLPYATLDNKRDFYKLVRHISKKADHIVTVSEASKRDIVNLLGVNESRVTNTYQSVDLPKRILNRTEDEVHEEVRSVFGLDHKKYFLFFGAIEPKKNVARIIEAYLASRSVHPLVIVGQPTWPDGKELQLLEALPYNKKTGRRVAFTKDGGESASILRVDYLPFPLLTSLVRSARAVVFPSLYEGFGLPILEAMQLGTAVITGNQGANPEVAGDAALIVDPYDVTSIARAIRDMGSDDSLVAHYETLGREQAKLFSPEKYAERLQAMYARLV